MISCLYKLIWIQIQHHLLKIQERRRPGLLRLLLQGKGDNGPRGILLTRVVRVADPLVPSYSPFPLLISPDPSFLLLKRKGRGQDFSTSSSYEKEAEERVVLLSFAPSSPSLPPFPLFPSSFLFYSPCYPLPPPSRCVYILLHFPIG